MVNCQKFNKTDECVAGLVGLVGRWGAGSEKQVKGDGSERGGGGGGGGGQRFFVAANDGMPGRRLFLFSAETEIGARSVCGQRWRGQR